MFFPLLGLWGRGGGGGMVFLFGFLILLFLSCRRLTSILLLEV